MLFYLLLIVAEGCVYMYLQSTLQASQCISLHLVNHTLKMYLFCFVTNLANTSTFLNCHTFQYSPEIIGLHFLLPFFF